MNIFETIAQGPIDKYGTPNGRYGRISVTERHQDKLWSAQHPVNQEITETTRLSNGTDLVLVPTWAWGKHAPIGNGAVKEGDIVVIFSTRQTAYNQPIGYDINTATRREVASVITDEHGVIRIKARKIGATGKGKGYRQYGTYDFVIL